MQKGFLGNLFTDWPCCLQWCCGAAANGAPLNYSGVTRSGYYCSGTNTTNHPVGDKLAEEFEVTYQEIMDRFCLEGMFGDHGRLPIETGCVSFSEVFDMRHRRRLGQHHEGYGTWRQVRRSRTQQLPQPLLLPHHYHYHNLDHLMPQSNGNGNGNGLATAMGTGTAREWKSKGKNK
jgi:hypothetical protein